MKYVAESHLHPDAKHVIWGPTTRPDVLGLKDMRLTVHRHGKDFSGTVKYSNDNNHCFIILDTGNSGWFDLYDLEPEDS